MTIKENSEESRIKFGNRLHLKSLAEWNINFTTMTITKPVSKVRVTDIKSLTLKYLKRYNTVL